MIGHFGGNSMLSVPHDRYYVGQVDAWDVHNNNASYVCYYSCRALWRAMIMQAVVDSLSEYKRTEYRLAKLSAIEWFKSNSNNFRLVCCLAGYSADVVSKKARMLIEASQDGDQRIKSLHKLDKMIV